MKLALPLVVIASLVTGWVVHEQTESRVPVRVASPAYLDVANLVTTNGVVAPVDDFQARANFPGMVEKVPVELGDKVQPGQMLVTMKDPYAGPRIATAVSAVSGATEAEQDIHSGGTQDERIALSGDLDHATQAQQSAQHSLQVIENLERQGAAGAGEVEAARKRLADANTTLATLQQRATRRFSPAAIAAADARLTDARAALGAAKVTFANANIASPVAGTVYSVSVAPYDFVPMGAELLRVADLRQVEIRAFFDEPEVGKLKAGQAVTITWEGRPGLTWHGHIRQAPVAAMPQGNRSVAECLIRVDDANGDLLPNTHVLVTVPIEQRFHVLTVPRRTLMIGPGGETVFRVIAGRLVKTPVKTGLINLDLVEITQGLTPQDVVAVQAEDNSPLTDNLAVEVKK